MTKGRIRTVLVELPRLCESLRRLGEGGRQESQSASHGDVFGITFNVGIANSTIKLILAASPFSKPRARRPPTKTFGYFWISSVQGLGLRVCVRAYKYGLNPKTCTTRLPSGFRKGHGTYYRGTQS